MAPSQVDELIAFGRRQPLLVAGLAVGAFGVYRLAGGALGSTAAPVTDTAVDSGAPTPVPVSPSNSDPFGNGGDVLGGSAGYGSVGLTAEDLANAIADALAAGANPTPAPPTTPGSLPGSVVCGALPSYPPAAGTRRICLNGRWQDVPIGTTLPPPTPRPTPTPTPTPTPRPTPTPTPVPVRWRIRVQQNALVRIYSLNSAGRIVSWVDQRWVHPTSTAPAQAQIHRLTVDGRSGAYTTHVTAGAYAGRTVRVGNGVSLERY